MITSLSNPRVQWIRELLRKRKARSEENLFVVEGVRLAEEALAAGGDPNLVLHTPDPDDRTARLIDGFVRRGAHALLVSDRVLRACATTESPQGLVAVVPIPHIPLPARPSLTVIVDGVTDPGNLGTLLRTALAAGVEAVFLTSGSVDAYNPKVVRGAMGAHFRLPIVSESPASIRRHIEGLGVWVAEPHDGQSIYQLDGRRPTALVLGSEARGPSPEWRGQGGIPVTIPIHSQVESLNTAAAAAVILFEILRQRGLS